MELVRSSSFVRAYNRLVRGNPSLELLFREKVAIFLKNPYDRSLKTHKLGGKLKDSFAFSLNHDLRVIFYFPKPGVAELENIGPHDTVY
jgi:mRNA-degrading endonuclease YafQ of YafQ-DinJ toxin-antitoxin module